MSGRAIRIWSWLHRWSSLACTVFLLLLCLTGLPLIFREEIDLALGQRADAPEMPEGTPALPLDALVAAARAHRPGETLRFMSRDDDGPAWFLSMGVAANARQPTVLLMVDGRTAAVLNEVRPGEGLMGTVFRMHVDLFADLPGTLFLGAMGLLFLLALVSGAVLYAPFMRKLDFGQVRRDRARRVRWLDRHNLLGVVTLVWALVVGATGTLNTLARPISAQWQATELRAMLAPWRGRPPVAEPVPLHAAVDAAEAAVPGSEAGIIAFPGSPYAGAHHYMVFLRGRTPLTARLITPALIDAQTGALTETRTMPWYVTALRLSQPLHFGDYGGLPLKVIWALLDLVTIVVLGSGLYLWIGRRRANEADVANAAEVRGAGK